MPGTKFLYSFSFSCYSVSEPVDEMHNCEVHELPAVVPQPQPVLEMCHVEYMVVAMQRRCEKYIVPALKFNNIIVSTAAHSIVMLCYGVAVAVFPTYMGVYVACVCVLRACRSSSIKRVNSRSGLCPSTPAYQTTPSPRSSCCAWRRPGCRRKK